MTYGPRLLKHYLNVFLEKHGINDPDCRAEIDDLCESFQEEFDKLGKKIDKLNERIEKLEESANY